MTTRLHRHLSVALIATLISLVGCSSGGGGSATGTPITTPSVTLSATSLSFASTAIGTASAAQSITLTNTGAAALTLSSVAISGTNASSFAQTNTCGASLGANASCTVAVTFTPGAAGALTATLGFTDNASGSPQAVALSGTGAGPLTVSLGISASTLTFPSTVVGFPSAAQAITFTNTGSGTLSLTNLAVSGTSSASFNESATTCGTSLAAASTCTATIVFTPTGSGPASATFTVTDNAANSPQTIAFTGTGSATATAAATVDCSVAASLCSNTFITATLPTDPISFGGFHGYADPSERKDPNGYPVYYAYSSPRTLVDGTHVVDLHIAESVNNGASFTFLGDLYQSVQTTQTASSAYSSVNNSSTETIDLLPIPLTGASAGQTLWVQAHQSYLVAPQGGIYDQLNVTGLISVSAVVLPMPSVFGTSGLLLGLSTAPEARLGAFDTDPSRNITQNLATLSAATSKCGNLGQSALWYQSGTLYLALECTEISGNGNIDANELGHFLYSTTPTGSDASKWIWGYVGEFLTAAQAIKLGSTSAENTPYSFFTEPAFALTKSGQLVVIATPGVFAPVGATQPVIQYGCRVIPITSLSPSGITLDIDATTGAPVVIAKITENDLYTSPNEGPAACTYEPAAANGIVMGRKYENDPTLGFYIYPVNTAIAP